MKLIIDGYNLLRYITRGSATRQEIEQFLGKLRRYSRATKHHLIIVFDGGEGWSRYQAPYHGLDIWYSGSQQTADDVIKDLLPRYNADEVVLISDDRQLNESAAEEHAIISVSPAVFIDRMQSREDSTKTKNIRDDAQLVKTAVDSSTELDALMNSATRHMSHTRKNDDTPAPIKDKKGSKIERRLDAVLRKL